MPIYVFGCKACGKRLEIARKMTDESAQVCECGQEMSKIPQAFRWYHSPYETLLDHMDKKHENWKRRLRHGN